MKRIFILLIIAGIIVVASTAMGDEKKVSWPAIQPLKKCFHLIDHKNMEAKLEIMGKDGAPLYLLECYLNAYEHEDTAFDYSGDFEYRLTSLYSKETYSTLLTEDKDQYADWESRGRFLIEELQGKCADYPEYGRIRHFKLRGMELTIEIKNIKVEAGSRYTNGPWTNRDRIGELEFCVAINPDINALSPIAEPTKYIEPPFKHPENLDDLSRDCEKILIRGNP